MCDYSLCGIPNRLAVVGEELVIYRFSTGSMGLVSRADLQASELKETAPGKTFWQCLKSFLALFDRQSDAAPAVCIPPGASLIVKNIPADLQRRRQVSQEEVAL